MRYTHNNVHGELTSLPGCSQVVVSHDVFAWPRGGGNAKEANHARCAYAEYRGYNYTLCTVDLANSVQLHILHECGWRKLDEFKSTKTGHFVGLFGKAL